MTEPETIPAEQATPAPQRSLWARPMFEVLDDRELCYDTARWPEPWYTHDIGEGPS